MVHSLSSKLLPRWKRFIFSFIGIVLSLIFSLTAAELVLRYQRQYIEHSDQLESGMMLYDRQLGWRLTPGWQGTHHHYDFDTSYQINNLGFREEPEHLSHRKDDLKHYAIVGDSFTFGTGVNNADTFTQHLNTLGNDTLLFTNYGIPGYSTDQEYLLFKRDIRPLLPDHLIVIVYLANDLFDNELAYPLQADNGKPFFMLDADGQLERKNSPVPMQSKAAAARQKNLQNIVVGNLNFESSFLKKTLGQMELFRRLGLFQNQPKIPMEYFETRFDDTLQLFYALVSAIESSTKEMKADLSIVLLPGRSAIVRPDSVSAQYQAFLGKQIIHQFKQHSGIQVIDLLAPLSKIYNENKTELYFPNEGHLTPVGHKTVANEIFNKISKHGR